MDILRLIECIFIGVTLTTNLLIMWMFIKVIKYIGGKK